MSDGIGDVARGAARWSLITEAAAKIVTPVTQLVLARILAPEAFGVLATVIMVSSFATMLADSGFQKYLVQFEFQSVRGLYRAANVAFWSSMFLAIALMGVIVIFRDWVAYLVGTPELGMPIAVASFSLPISVCVSTQQALFRRAFVYKKLLPIRVTVALIPLVVSLPLALQGFGYWSLIIGVLASNLTNAAALTIVSEWKPRFYFSFALLKRMFSFSGWSLLEAISIWATLWSGTFIVGNILTASDLGLYRQPILVVNSAFAVVTSATTPILFASLSRLQTKQQDYKRFFLRFQFVASAALFPIGVGAFFYRDFFTGLLFGPKWSEAALMFGAWALTTSLNIVLAHYSSEVFRSLGRPRVSLLSQCLYMIAMIPALYFAALDGFITLVVVNAGIRLVGIAISQLLMYLVAGIGILRVMKNLYAPFVSAVVMGSVAALLSNLADGSWWLSALGILVCSLVYTLVALCFAPTRELVLNLAAIFRRHPS